MHGVSKREGTKPLDSGKGNLGGEGYEKIKTKGNLQGVIPGSNRQKADCKGNKTKT